MVNKKSVVDPSKFRDQNFKLLDATHIEEDNFVLNEDIAKKYHVKTIETNEGEEQHLVKNLNINFQKIFACVQATFFLAFSSAAGYAAVTTPKEDLKEIMRMPHVYEQEAEGDNIKDFFENLQKDMDEHRKFVNEKRAKEKEEFNKFYESLFNDNQEEKTKTK